MARKVIGVARNVAGPPGSWRRRWATLITLAIIASAGFVFVQNVLAVKDAGLIQLDADADHDTQELDVNGDPAVSDGVDDWDNVCYEAVQKPVTAGGLGLSPGDAAAKCGTNVETAGGGDGAIAVAWVEEPSPASTIFTGGGSKDPQDLDSGPWLWKDDANNPPDKDNIVHAYAARYQVAPGEHCPNGTMPGDPDALTKKCDVLFFGLDRSDASGDANSGFWFFQNEIGLVAPQKGGTGTFSGEHRAGDILIISGFSNGGTEATISVYRWDPFCAADGKNENPPNPNPPGNDDPSCKADNLRLVAALEDAAAECTTSAPTGGQACGIVNPPGAIPDNPPTPSIVMPWVFVNKSNTPNNGVLNGEFFEAGINLTALGLDEGCFQSVVSETRSSTSPTSVLKDFVLGGFGECETTLSTTASLNGVTSAIAAGNGADSGTASSGTDTATLVIKGVSEWGGTLDFHLCGPLASNATLCTNAGFLVTSKTVTNASLPADFTSGSTTLTSAGRYCWFAKFTPDTATAAKGVLGAEHAGTAGVNNTECFTIGAPTPTLDTQAVASPVAFGGTIQDNATILGLAKEPGSNGGDTDFPTINATNGVFVGKITFTLTGPNSCSTVPTGFTAQDFNINSSAGNGTYGPASFTVDLPNQPGTYSWKATYSNTVAINNPATWSHNLTCTDTDEDVVVQQIATQISTSPFSFPNDTAKIKADSGSLPQGGTILFKLYNSSANCTANGATGLVFSESKAGPANATTTEFTAATNNTSVSINLNAGGFGNGTYYWRVIYTPGNTTTHTARQSNCEETTTVTHVAAAYPGTLFVP